MTITEVDHCPLTGCRPEPDRRRQGLIKYFGGAGPHPCHWCSRAWPIDEILRALDSGGIAVQGVTGRIFCAPACWRDYLAAEGLS